MSSPGTSWRVGAFATHVLPHRSLCYLVPALLPSCFLGYIIAALADANHSAFGVPIKRWFLGIFLRARYAPRARRLLRYRFALLIFPPLKTRSGACIGCDHAAYQRRRKDHEHQTNPQGVRREQAERGQRTERLLDRGRRNLRSQERQGLRSRHPRRHQRQRPYCLHRAQEGRRLAVTRRRPLALRLRRAVFFQQLKGDQLWKKNNVAAGLRNASSTDFRLRSTSLQTVMDQGTIRLRSYWTSRRIDDPGRLSQLRLRRAALSIEAGRCAECSAFLFPTAHVLRNAGRTAFCVSHVVSMLNRSGRETQIRIDAKLILRFSFRMIRVSTSGSKWCVVIPHPAMDAAPSVRRMASTWQGRGTLPLHPSPCAAWSRQVEPVAGSTPPVVRV
jgi:hypothetical protein